MELANLRIQNFPEEGVPRQAGRSNQFFVNFPKKMHESVNKLARGGGHTSLVPPLGSASALNSMN